jgi:radical SAM superfamily enzyme YgiQ (UPF0313 family)
MKFNFIIPSWSYWAEPTRAQPLTQMYLATILEEEGHSVNFVDFRDGPKELPKANANFYTIASPDFKEVSEIVRKNPGVHIAGGPHASIFPIECLDVFNAVAIGRGEESINQIARDLESGDLMTFYNIPATGEYPFPRRHFLPREKIVTSLFKTKDVPSTTVLFSHGCPFQCTFCANYDRGPIKRRSLESIGNEIDYLREGYDIKGLSLQDEICIPKNGDIDFLDLMKSKRVLWRGQARAGILETILRMAKESGCIELSFGLESVDQTVIDYAKKKMSVETVKQTLRDCRKHGIKTRLYLLNGLPGEPNDIIEQTKRFIDENKPDVVLLSTLQPYPGSEIYNHPERFGIEYIDRDFSRYNHLRCRFADSRDKLEEAVPFEYKEGHGFSKERIMANLIELQTFLRERGLNK